MLEPTTATPAEEFPRGVIVLLGAASLVVTTAGIGQLAWLFGPGFLALVLVICTSPIYTFLRARGAAAWIALTALLVTAFSLVIVLVVVIAISVAQLATLLPTYAGRIGQVMSELTASLQSFGIGPEQLQSIVGALDLRQLGKLLLVVLSQVTGFASVLTVILALMLFRCLEVSGVRHQTSLDPWRQAPERGAFITHYIPNVRFILGVVPPALLALLEGDWKLMVVVIVVYAVLNFVIQSLVQPKFVGDAVDLSITMTFVSLLCPVHRCSRPGPSSR